MQAVARWLKLWLRHTEDVPELSTQRGTLIAMADYVTANLLGTAPDPLVWAHGDLHDRQIIAGDGRPPFGLLDFDDAARAEAARDLAYLDFHLERRMRRNNLTSARYLTAHTEVLAVAGNCSQPGSVRCLLGRTLDAPGLFFVPFGLIAGDPRSRGPGTAS